MSVKRLVLSTLFVVMLTIPTVLGAIPLKVVTPVGVVSTEVSEAEARNRNTTANRPRSLQARNAGANRVQSFSASRTSYTVNVRQSTNRADIRIGIREGQQHRWRIDTRNTSGNWRNGSYNSWRARATRNINRDVRVSVSQGQERRLRVQIRDANGNVRTITVNVRRASGNTYGANLRANAGTFNRNFGRATTNYTLTIPRNRTAATQVGMRAEQERGMTRNRVRIQNPDGTWRSWSPWSSYTRGQSNRNVGTIPSGRQAQVEFMVRGAFSNMPNTPTRTRVYTVNVVRPQPDWASLRVTSNFQVDWCRPFNANDSNRSYTLTFSGSGVRIPLTMSAGEHSNIEVRTRWQRVHGITGILEWQSWEQWGTSVTSNPFGQIRTGQQVEFQARPIVPGGGAPARTFTFTFIQDR